MNRVVVGNEPGGESVDGAVVSNANLTSKRCLGKPPKPKNLNGSRPEGFPSSLEALTEDCSMAWHDMHAGRQAVRAAYLRSDRIEISTAATNVEDESSAMGFILAT